MLDPIILQALEEFRARDCSDIFFGFILRNIPSPDSVNVKKELITLSVNRDYTAGNNSAYLPL